MKIGISLTVMILLSVTGCMKTTAQKTSEVNDLILNTATASLENCVKSYKPSNELAWAELKEFGFDNPKIKLESKLIKANLSDTQKVAALEYWKHGKECRSDYDSQLSIVNPQFAQVSRSASVNIDAFKVQLLQDQITIGEYFVNWDDEVSKANQNWGQAVSRYNQLLNQSHNSEIQRRQAAAASMQRQQMINQMNQPTFTSCNVIGNTVNCNSF